MTLGAAPTTNTRKAADVTLGKREQVAARLPWERLRGEATAARRDTTEHLDELVAMFTRAAQAAGHKVVHAADNASACRAVMTELGGSPQVIIKSKSMVTEEIGLRHHMESLGFTVFETDLGEWIVQVRGELPSHVTAPAIHLSAAQIAETLSGVVGRGLTSDPTALTGVATDYLRQPLRSSSVGISGANFLIAETGEIVVIENEGNAYFCTSTPTHVVVTGIDKVIRKRSDLPALLRVLTVSATGQPQTVYTHVVARSCSWTTGARRSPGALTPKPAAASAVGRAWSSARFSARSPGTRTRPSIPARSESWSRPTSSPRGPQPTRRSSRRSAAPARTSVRCGFPSAT